MSYQVLARKWRPQTFADVVGQQHVLTALANGLSMGRIHHAYLFSGTRGVGKTSIARLLAKGLNCETGITATPCGVCDNCREIEQGRFVDLIEIDAASRTKVEDTRDLLDNVQYAPARGRFKVYLIDEVHMLSAGITKVVGTEARGFLFGAPVALELGVGFVPVRKPGKLPRETIAENYELEYGTDQLEIHVDAIQPGDKVLVVDDLLATGGTIEATVKLIRRLGGEVTDAAFIINLFDIGGEQRLEKMGVKSYSLVLFPGH